ncbi:hypothetical protein RFI_20137 [Reticulomyxa filosa]|uniref:Uncharacterized protein n=1 Tax=Reticulomyxa filosa TaxID=46433 RepID=X6MT76_RETFI|nr:hypothetical protein RFI_20137 [Reticulomyxa filosa]|eukprot:ETO17193.1 hypothetical protein RFI_20137 [Reticulomyxa filosa]
MSWKVIVSIASEKYELKLSALALVHFKKQVLEECKVVQQENECKLKITNINGEDIETDEHLQKAIGCNQLEFIAYFQSKSKNDDDDNKKDEISPISNEKEMNTLDFWKHWSVSWIKANVEAAKAVEQMIQKNEQGLIIIANNIIGSNNPNTSLFVGLINSSKLERKEFGEYKMYLIKQKLVMLDEVSIDGNVYAIDCQIQCKGHVEITTQLFVIKDVIIDETLKLSISPIQWNNKIHHDIPVRVQKFENEADEYAKQKLLNEASLQLEQAVKLCVENFGIIHPYVANTYNNLGLAYLHNQQWDKAIEFIFGTNHTWIANLYNNLGITYKRIKQYDKAIENYEKALQIALHTFGNNHIFVADMYRKLGNIFRDKKEYQTAIDWFLKSLEKKELLFGKKSCVVADANADLAFTFYRMEEEKNARKYYEEAWKIYDVVSGQFDRRALAVKNAVRNLSEYIM